MTRNPEIPDRRIVDEGHADLVARRTSDWQSVAWTPSLETKIRAQLLEWQSPSQIVDVTGIPIGVVLVLLKQQSGVMRQAAVRGLEYKLAPFAALGESIRQFGDAIKQSIKPVTDFIERLQQ